MSGTDGVEWLRRLRLDGSEGAAATPYLDLLVTMAYVALVYADYPQARRYCQELMQLSGGRAELLKYYREALHKLGQVAHNEGRFAEAVRHDTECLRLAPPDDSIRIWLTDRLSTIHVDLGDLDQAAQFAARARVTAEQSDALTNIAAALLSTANVALAYSRLDEAESCLARVERIADETGNRFVWVRYLLIQARLARRMGQAVAAQQSYQRAYELATSMGRRKEMAWAQAGVGFALLDQGKHEEARGWLLAALQAAWQQRIMPEVVWAVVGLAVLQGAAGQLERAEQWLRVAHAHPACPKRVAVEIEEIRCRLALPEMPAVSAEAGREQADAALAAVVVEARRIFS